MIEQEFAAGEYGPDEILDRFSTGRCSVLCRIRENRRKLESFLGGWFTAQGK